MHLTRLAASLAVVLSSGAALASQGPDDVAARLATLVPRLMEEAVVPGVQIALIRNGTTAWHGAFGLANTQTSAPVTEASVFEAASLTSLSLPTPS